jgi:hypothetical protein
MIFSTIFKRAVDNKLICLSLEKRRNGIANPGKPGHHFHIGIE